MRSFILILAVFSASQSLAAGAIVRDSGTVQVAGVTYRLDGIDAHWRGIYDDHGRVMVAISFNSDIGDSWEWSNVPQYPQKFSDLGMRIGVNYVVYAMTH